MNVKRHLVLMSFALLLVLPSVAAATKVHNFHCDTCHLSGLSMNGLAADNICLSCHNVDSPASVLMNYDLVNPVPSLKNFDGAGGDASNRFGNNLGHAAETSHNWAASSNNPEAGAVEPTHPGLVSKSGITSNRVACSRCHNPHMQKENNPSLLPQTDRVTVMTPNEMCLACHKPFANSTTAMRGLGSHPVNMVYPAAAADDGYKDVIDNGTAGEIILVDGKISCMTCHGVHETDSNAATADGFAGAPGAGDGLLLKHNGPGREDPENDASICQACHEYKGHGMAGANKMGCMVCHGGHEYDATAPNYFMLKKQVDLPYIPKLSGAGTAFLDYTALDTAWQDGGAGFCESCHVLPLSVAEHNTGVPQDRSFCTGCHKHEASAASFGGACNSCHGYAPSVLAAGGPDGYAYVDDLLGPTAAIHDYSTDANSKNEATTAHKNHAGIGAADYSFPCQECHSNFTTPHPALDDNFQDVAFVGGLAETGIVPTAYDKAGNGTCATLYCHSNGRVRGTSPDPATIPDWATGAGTGGRDSINDCVTCHDIDSGGLASTRLNSPTHQAHMAQGYTCDFCHHDTTEIDNTTLLGSAIGGVHVDGVVNVVVDPANVLTSSPLPLGDEFNESNATCGLYCHSDGRGNTVEAPVWTDATTGECGDCHGNPPADTTNGGSHERHVSDLDGPQLACAVCHTNNSVTATLRVHVDGVVDADFDVCNACHGATPTGTGVDLKPTWGQPASVNCRTCHQGALADFAIVSGPSAPAKDLFETEGHGSVAAFVNAPSNGDCNSCHDTSLGKHFDGTSGDNQLNGEVAADTTFCQSCHTDINVHMPQGTGNSSPADACNICHEPHGEGMGTNSDAMLIVGENFADRTVASSYYDTTGSTGVCQTCHSGSDGVVDHYNDTPLSDGHNDAAAGGCISCHTHTSAPQAFLASCNGCHGDQTNGQYWPFGSGGSIPTANDEVGRHDEHVLTISQYLGYGDIATLLAAGDTGAKQKEICAYCHVDPGTATTHNNGSKNTDFRPIWDVAATAAGSIASDNCSNIACHNNKATNDATLSGKDFRWNTATPDVSECALCHADVTDTVAAAADADTTIGTHLAHTSAATNYGRVVDCETCHATGTAWGTAPSKANGHWNGSWNVSGSVTLTYGGSWASAPGSCATNECHNDGTGTGAPVRTIAAGDATDYTWATAEAGVCDICHAEPPATGKHAEHVANTTFVPSSCVNCHTAATAVTHINTTVQTANQVTVYNGTPNFTCTNACHTADTVNDWTTGGSLACGDCHDSGKDTTLISGVTDHLDRGWPDGTKSPGGAHDIHVGNFYVAANCVDCHNDNSGGHVSAIDGTITSIALGAKVDSYVLNNCTNSCHVAADTNDWTAGSRACLDCHSGTYLGGGPNAPASGLHAPSNAENHTAAGFNCVDCHDPTNPSNAHITGVLQDSTAATYTFNAAATNPVTYTSQAVGCATACHLDGGGWSRKWIGVVDAKPAITDAPSATVCGNCHGTFDTGWRNGMSARHSGPDAGGEIQANHTGDGNDCNLCHAWQDTNYTAGMHKDSAIQLNQTNVGFVDHLDGTVGCSNCHSATDGLADGQHQFVQTLKLDGWGIDRWARADIAGPAGSCDSCHAANITDGGGAHLSGNDNLALHNAHNLSPYIDTDGNFVPGDSSTYNDCDTCHGHNGAAGHKDGTVKFLGGIAATSNYATNTNYLETCGINSCHDSDNKSADLANGEWKSADLGKAGDNACEDCHGSSAGYFTLLQGWTTSAPFEPTSALHTKHLANANYVSSDCDHCHADSSTAGTHGTHQDTTLDTGLSTVAQRLTAYVAGTQTCTLTCHTITAGDWATAKTLSCTNCHGSTADLDAGNTAWTDVDTADGKHGTHAGTPSYGGTGQTATGAGTTYDFACGECHNGTHLNASYATVAAGTAEEVNASVNWDSGTSSCDTNDCHNDGTLAEGPANAAGNGNLNWGTVFTGDRCAKCHGNIPATGAHTVHQVGIHADDIYSGVSGLLAAGTEPSAHGGKLSDGTTPSSTVINCQVCHFATVTTWNNDLNPTCATACHGNGNGAALGNLEIAFRENHIDAGAKDVAEVVFFNSTVKSKAQLRNEIDTNVPEVNDNWQRERDGALESFYKTLLGITPDADGYDVTKQTLLAGGTYTAGATATCTTACHNGNAANWETPQNNCMACHTQLPK